MGKQFRLCLVQKHLLLRPHHGFDFLIKEATWCSRSVGACQGAKTYQGPYVTGSHVIGVHATEAHVTVSHTVFVYSTKILTNSETAMLSTTDKIVQTIADDIMDFDPINM